MEQAGLVDEIHVILEEERFLNTCSTKNCGESVRCRNDPYLSDKLNRIITIHEEQTEMIEDEIFYQRYDDWVFDYEDYYHLKHQWKYPRKYQWKYQWNYRCKNPWKNQWKHQRIYQWNY